MNSDSTIIKLSYDELVDGETYLYNSLEGLHGWFDNATLTDARKKLLKELEYKHIYSYFSINKDRKIGTYIFSPESATFLKFTGQYL